MLHRAVHIQQTLPGLHFHTQERQQGSGA
jgi:hypothetical protein